jgi:hypothetical protein
MTTNNTTFLDLDELRWLTGWAQKSKQIAQLRRMGIPFYVNALGLPIVARSVIEGTRTKIQEPNTRWRSAIDGT